MPSQGWRSGLSKVDPTRFVERKVGDGPQVDPIDRAFSQAEKVADERNAQARWPRSRRRWPCSHRRNVRRPAGGGAFAASQGVGDVHGYVSQITDCRVIARQLSATLPVARQSASSATRSSISAEVSGWKSAGRPSLLGVSSACRDRGGR